MKTTGLFLLLFLFSTAGWSQQTHISGVVTDVETGEPMPDVLVQFQDSKISVFTDTAGFYDILTYYATDSLKFSYFGYSTKVVAIKKDKEQLVNIKLVVQPEEMTEFVLLPPDEFPSTTLHKRVVANKDANNKEKLNSYGYELYS